MCMEISKHVLTESVKEIIVSQRTLHHVQMKRAALLVLLVVGVLGTSRTWRANGDDNIKPRYPQTWLWTRFSDPRILAQEANNSETPVYFTGEIEQRLDHTNPSNTRTWHQRYLKNNSSYVSGGPAFVMLAGAADYTNDWLRSSHMADLGEQFGADTFFFHTRFYSEPRPTPDASSANLRFLSTEQIVQDVVHLLSELRAKEEIREGQRVVLFGAGYGGSLAYWIRKRYPDLVVGAVASSAITKLRVEMNYYFPSVEHALQVLHQKDTFCVDAAKAAYVAFHELFSTPEGRAKFNQIFRPCKPIAEEIQMLDLDRAQALGLAASLLADVAQENTDAQHGDALFVPCYLLSADVEGVGPVDRLAALLTNKDKCLGLHFAAAVEQASTPVWTRPENVWGLRPWLWQKCTELGMFATATSTTSFPYTDRIDMDYHRELCSAAFNTSFSELATNLQRLLHLYGDVSTTKNVIFVNGDLDPWKDAAPTEGPPGVYVFNVLRASHAQDMFKVDMWDPPRLKAVRKRVARIIKEWL